MGFAEKRGNYYRARYNAGEGKYLTVLDCNGVVVKFGTKREAKKAADDAEADLRRAGAAVDADVRRAASRTALGSETFGDYVSRWYGDQDLAPSTMENYCNHIEGHLLPHFDAIALSAIERRDIKQWEKGQKALYAASSVKTWRSTLHLILADAVDENLISSNPATQRRGRGKRAGRSRDRGPERVVTDPVGLLLIAERAALLSGRDDEFLGVILKGYTGLRWGELVGLETAFARPRRIRVEWQLYELGSGELVRCPPKDDSYRDVDIPDWLSRLVANHISEVKAAPCVCHGKTYVFRGLGTPRTREHHGPKAEDVARLAGVSTGTVSNVLNRPDRVADSTRVRVETAIADLGFVSGGRASGHAAHWRRSGFAAWVFTPAASGWYPKKAPQEARPVPVTADGVPTRGRNSQGRATACWVPIASGFTPHGCRHTHRTVMDELGTPKVLMDERMGHIDGSVSARYAHVTPGMRAQLMKDLTRMWEWSLAARRAMSPRSHVAVLDRLLQELP